MRAAALGILAALLAGVAGPAPAAPARRRPTGTLLEAVHRRDDLTAKERKRWISELKRRFGPDAQTPEGDGRVEVSVARAILSSAIFMRVEASPGVEAAWAGWRSVIARVPPPVAIHYEVLALQGKKPRGRPIDLAFKFQEYFSEEVAPDLVAYWEAALRDGRIPDDAREQTLEALEATRLKMRPLLLDRLRVLARLERDLGASRGARRAEIERDMKALEDELGQAFTRVARRPEVLDRRKRPFDRLRIELEDRGLTPSVEDRWLDPDGPPPPRRPVPLDAEPAPASAPLTAEGAPLTEPAEAPPTPIPDQARPGDPNPRVEPGLGRSLAELSSAYQRRLTAIVAPWLGTPYVFGAASPGTGTDASGFTSRVLQTGFAVEVPRLARDQFRVGVSVPRNALRPGDLVFFDTLDTGQVSHVGVYAGGGQFAHASADKGVVYARLDERYFQRAYRGARRVLVYPD